MYIAKRNALLLDINSVYTIANLMAFRF